MNNNQKGYGVKKNRGGINNKFVCVTGRTFVECVETELGNVEDCHVQVRLPSPPSLGDRHRWDG